MNGVQLARLVTELCLAEDRPLSEVLPAFAPGPAESARSGKLAVALRQLGYDKLHARLGAAWPAALRRATGLSNALPRPSTLRVPLAQTCAWFALIALVQAAVLAMLRLKVFPAFEAMQTGFGTASLPLAESAATLLAGSVLGLVLLGLLGAAGSSWLPGWGRHLRAAHEAALTAALLQTAAPPDVFGIWVRESKSLRKASQAPIADDLLALCWASGQRAENAMQRFVIGYRYLGTLLFAAVALGITHDVYDACAQLSRLR